MLIGVMKAVDTMIHHSWHSILIELGLECTNGVQWCHTSAWICADSDARSVGWLAGSIQIVPSLLAWTPVPMTLIDGMIYGPMTQGMHCPGPRIRVMVVILIGRLHPMPPVN